MNGARGKEFPSRAARGVLLAVVMVWAGGCSGGEGLGGRPDGAAGGSGTGGGSGRAGGGGAGGRDGGGGTGIAGSGGGTGIAGSDGSAGGGGASGSGGGGGNAVSDASAADGDGPAAAPDAVAGDGGSSDGGGVTCPTSSDPPPSGPDSVTFLPNVTVDTLVGSGTWGSMDGSAAIATFSNPVSVLVEPAGTLIVCDFDSNLLRRVDATGAVTTLTSQSGFQRPFGLGYGADGSLFVDTDFNPSGVKDSTTGTIWRIDPVSGAATVVAANLGRPRAFAALPGGPILLADYQNARVRLLDPTTGVVTDLAGDPACRGMVDGQGRAARFASPYGVAPLPDGSFVVSDYDNHLLRRVTTDGQVSVFAGDGGEGTVDGPLLAARFAGPKSLAADRDGNIYVTDDDAHRIRRVGRDGTVTTVAGDGIAGFQDGAGAAAELYAAEGIAISADGLTIFVADGDGGEAADPYNRIRRITLGP